MRRKTILAKIFLYSLAIAIIISISPLLFEKYIQLKEPFFIYPLHGQREFCVRADNLGDGHFGARRSNGRRRHKGLDILGKVGETVVASKSGRVKTGEVARGMGKYVTITHFDGYKTIYGHLNYITVKDKSWIWQGEKLGEVGKSGNASYPDMQVHLHFEIRKDGVAQDPLPYINEAPGFRSRSPFQCPSGGILRSSA